MGRVLTVRLESSGAGETERIGRSLGEAACGGEVLALTGELGAGKTTLVRGLARGLGVAEDEAITSPTFVLLLEYPGRLRLLHLDAYRLAGSAEFDMLGALPEGSECDRCVVAIEWADRVGASVPADRIAAQIEHAGPTRRVIVLEPHGPDAEEWLKRAAPWLPQSGHREHFPSRTDATS